ncbi:MAG: cytochrome-c peroxidase [Bacteroidetes bacterium]|nr:MAG: cytochrome-c peroxidase [Bacteroidota bacterium]
MRNSKYLLTLGLIFGLIAGLESCKPDEPPTVGTPGPTTYVLDVPSNWPLGNFIAENPLTNEGVELGRYLFYDPLLSKNSSQSCASCHNQGFGFTDHGLEVSLGSEGAVGTKNAMALFNLNWSSGYFWDGRQSTLESLAGEPITAVHEMNLSLTEAVARLKAHPSYPARFKQAFPDKEITETTLRFAIAQFIRSITSYQSKWDEYVQKTPQNPAAHMTASEARGFNLFLSETGADCRHCHTLNSPFIIDLRENEFANNGLEASPDSGYARVTGKASDIGKFKTPSLRNLAYTAPYMHDGRFATLEEVLDHYDHGFQFSSTLNVNLVKHMDANQQPIPRLSAQDKQDVIAFLKLLNDSTLVTNPKWKSPF